MKKWGVPVLCLAAMLTFCGCGEFFTMALEDAEIEGIKKEEDNTPQDVTDGRIGQTIATEFYEFTVNEAWRAEYYGNSMPPEGYYYLVANVSVKNTYRNPIQVYDTDFQVQWDGGVGKADPLIGQGKLNEEGVLPVSYDLESGASQSGLLIYEVPTSVEQFSMVHSTVFSDKTEGASYYVNFAPELRMD